MDFYDKWQSISVLMDQYDFDDLHWSIVLSAEVLNSSFTSRIGGAISMNKAEGIVLFGVKLVEEKALEREAEAAKSSGMVYR